MSGTEQEKDSKEVQNQDIEKQVRAVDNTASKSVARPDLQHVPSHVSHHDMHHVVSYVEAGDEVYDRLSAGRKTLITAVLAFCGFLAPISSTSVLSAVPEVASTYDTTGTVINLSNALYLVSMGCSPMFWGPCGQVFGRRYTCIACAFLFFAMSVGTALAPTLASFFVFRILTAFQGTAFLIVGASCIGDIYKPTERATALGWFLSGTVVGPAVGPFVGGIIVTFKTWRDIFWLQSALGGLATVLVAVILPETIHHKKAGDLKGLTGRAKAQCIWRWTNPWRVLQLFRYPNLMIAGLASSALVWNMYSLLTPIRYVLNPRFNLTTPIQSGLFYIAPGCGYVVGTFFGGRWADHIVKKWIRKRGVRIPEDRLRSCTIFMGVIIPACMLIYGWCVERRKGGIPVPVLAMFVQGVAQLFCFPSLNAYCLDVMQSRSAEVVAGNYVIRYVFAALGSAVCLPAIQHIGVGWFSTISAGFLVVVTLLLEATARYGKNWRDRIDSKAEETSTQNAT